MTAGGFKHLRGDVDLMVMPLSMGLCLKHRCVHCVFPWVGLGTAVSLHGGLGGKQDFPNGKKKRSLYPGRGQGGTADS